MSLHRDNAVKINIDDRDKATSPAASRKQSLVKDDFRIPVVYQSVSAEVQNVIDKLANFERQSSSGGQQDNEFRNRARSTSENREDGYYMDEDLDAINQLSMHREQKKAYLKRAAAGESPLVKDEYMKQLSYGHDPLPRNLTKPTGKPDNFMSRASVAVRKFTGQEEEHPINIVDEATVADHLMSINFLEQKYQTKRNNGLTTQQVEERLQRDGLNVLTPPKQKPLWLQFLICLVGGFGSILWVAGTLCILAYQPLGDPPDVYNIILAIVIFLVIFAQAIFFFMQERRSTNLLASFSSMIPINSQVLRDHHWQSVESARIVVGDIVRIKEGDKIPADMRVFEVHQAKVEKSGLTGENEPIPLSESSTDPNLYETRNLALFGTSVIEGSAVGIVINTSDRTVMGKIAKVASSTSSVTTSLQRELNYFIGMVAVMSLIACAIVVIGYYVGVYPSHPKFLSVSAVITFCIAVVVSLLPEGTPVALALILTMIAKRMYAAQILVKKLTVLETLGSATLIASDKTGTLTQNKMTVNHLWIPSDRPLTFDPENDSLVDSKNETGQNLPENQLSGCYRLGKMGKSFSNNAAVVFLCQIMSLCNKTVFDSKDDKTITHKVADHAPRKVIGNPTEGALLNCSADFVDVDELRKRNPIVTEIAFSSRKKFHATVHEITDTYMFQNSGDAIEIGSHEKRPEKGYYVFVKGAPEYILSMCTKAVVDKAEISMDPTTMNRIMKANELFATNGERVLAFAYRKIDQNYRPTDNQHDEEMLTQNLCFLGLVGIIDPPRIGVADAIDECRTAHIRVMMITGDHPTTAVSISKSVNIITKDNVKTILDVIKDVPNVSKSNQLGHDNKVMEKVKGFFAPAPHRTFKDEAIVITGTDVSTLTDAQWDYVLSHREVVFARTTPQHKLQIVKEARLRGDMVAVTGDGVNDAPALKAADLGIAMGICGSDVSKEAANMVLLDDNFVTIVNGIKEGRVLFDNLKKVICYLFPNGSFSEILPVLAAVFLGMQIPLSTFLMILICIGSDMIGSLALVHEAPESDIMTREPRNARTDRLVNAKTILFAYFFVGIMESSIAFFMFFLTCWIEGGVPPSKIVFAFEKWGNETWIEHMDYDQQMDLIYKGQTAYFVALVMCQLWNLLAVRTRYQSIFTHKFQPKLIYYMLGEVAVVICCSYLPVINNLVYTRPAPWYNWFIPMGMGSVILICDEIRKYFVRKYPNGILRKLAW